MDHKSITGSPPLYMSILNGLTTSQPLGQLLRSLYNVVGTWRTRLGLLFMVSILSPSPFARYSRSIFCRSGALYGWTSRFRAAVLSVQRSIHLFRWLRIFSAGACVRDLHAFCDEYVEEHASQPQATVVGQARAFYYSR